LRFDIDAMVWYSPVGPPTRPALCGGSVQSLIKECIDMAFARVCSNSKAMPRTRRASAALVRKVTYLAAMLLSLAMGWCCALPAHGACRYQTAFQSSAADFELGSSHGLSSAYRGRWQTVGGNVYFVFHPQPMPCDGPFCKSPADNHRPSDAAITIPTRCCWAVESICVDCFGTRDAEAFLWHYPVMTHITPASGPLRPPCTAV